MIKGFVGTYGTGKTLWLVKHAQWYFAHGCRVVSNMPIWGYYKGKKVQADFIYNDKIFDLLTNTLFQDKLTLLIIDEASTIFDSYKFKNIPPDVWEMLKQSRKLKLDIFYTTQRHQDIATRVRENSAIIYLCKQHNLGFRIYSAMGVLPVYFSDQAKSVMLKSYIVKRNVSLGIFMKKYYRRYMTEFVITSRENFIKYRAYLDDPETITPFEIIKRSKIYHPQSSPL